MTNPEPTRIRFECPEHGSLLLTGGIPCCPAAVATLNPTKYPAVKVDASHAGCWIAGHHGHYGPARLVRIAADHGWEDVEAVEAADRYLAGDTAEQGTDNRDGIADYLVEAADDAEAWLSDHVAPAGYSFGWHDGEFFLWSSHDWAEAAGEQCEDECEVCHPNLWTLLDSPPEGCEAVASLWSWSLNYDGTKGPAFVLADMLVSEDEFGENLFSGDLRTFGYLELEKLHAALGEYLADQYAVREFLRRLIKARG